MNLSKAWNTKLEVASFLLSKILSKKCVPPLMVRTIWVVVSQRIFVWIRVGYVGSLCFCFLHPYRITLLSGVPFARV